MINWREIPFIRLTLPFAVGIILAANLRIPIPHYTLSFLFIIPVITWLGLTKQAYKFRWIFGLILSVFLFFFGYQHCYNYFQINQSVHFSHLVEDESKIALTGIVTNKSSGESWQKIQLEIIEGEKDSHFTPCRGKLLTYIETSEKSRNLGYGDKILLNGRISELAPPANPHSFDYKQYLEFQNIYHQAFIRTGDWKFISEKNGNIVLAIIYNTREKYLSVLRRHIPTPNEFAVASALILGYKEEITKEIKNAYASTGAMHVLAVSGLHVGMIYLFIEFIFKLFPIHHRYWKFAKILISLAIIWSYALVTGASPSVLRAATMFSFLLVGKYSRRDSNIYNSLAASAFCLLMINPFLLMQPGFQLSYLALTGIVYFQPKIYKLIYVRNKVLDHFWALTCVAIAAQITTFPISIYYFHQFPVSFLLSGFIVVDAAFLILSTGILLFITDFFAPIASLSGKFLHLILTLTNKVILYIEQIPYSLLEGLWISLLFTFLLYIFLLCAVIANESRNFAWVKASAICLLILSSVHTVEKWLRFNTREVIVYSIKGSTAVDCMERNNSYHLFNEPIPPDQVLFSIQPHRTALSKHNVTESAVQDEVIAKVNNYYKHQHLVYFNNKCFVVANDSMKLQKKVIADYIVLTQNTKLSLDELSQWFNCIFFIADNSNSYYTLRKWKNESEKLGLEFYNVREKGAFILNLVE